MMSCREIVDFLLDYSSGEQDAPTRERFEQHIAVCPPCVTFMKTYEQSVKLGKAALGEPCEEIPPELVKAIIAARDKTS
ncbi:MAG: zf-HC2 domain-containing protein [Planctomycetes bacterium]|nr:zf-HC2 domain-containing protein [Planctomycetota bacterium]